MQSSTASGTTPFVQPGNDVEVVTVIAGQALKQWASPNTWWSAPSSSPVWMASRIARIAPSSSPTPEQARDSNGLDEAGITLAGLAAMEDRLLDIAFEIQSDAQGLGGHAQWPGQIVSAFSYSSIASPTLPCFASISPSVL